MSSLSLSLAVATATNSSPSPAHRPRIYTYRCCQLGGKLLIHVGSIRVKLMDDAFCARPEGLNLNSRKALVSTTIAAIVLMADPRHVAGWAFNVGNATLPG